MRRLVRAVRGKLTGEQGQTFILVMTVTALATVLGIMAMSGALMSVRLYGSKRISDKNFYKLEMVLEEVKAGLTRDVADFYYASQYFSLDDDEPETDENGDPVDAEDTEDTGEAEDTEDTEAVGDIEDTENSEDIEDTETGEEGEDAEDSDEPEDGENAEDTEEETGDDEIVGPVTIPMTGNLAPPEWFLRNQVGIFDPTIYEATSKIQMDTRKEAGLKLLEEYLSNLSPSVTPEDAKSITVERTEVLSVEVEDIKIDPDGTLVLQGVHLILTNYERDARSEIRCNMVIHAPYSALTVEEVVRLEKWERIG